jgi:hypothetical protein
VLQFAEIADSENGGYMSKDVVMLRRITVDEFIDLRNSVGWGVPEKKAIVIGLEKYPVFCVLNEMVN